MNTSYPEDTVLFEHRFWLQILGDHSRFILDSLPIEEAAEIQRARNFIAVFDSMLGQAQGNITGQALVNLTQQAYLYACEIRAFKLHLLKREFTGKIKIQLSPTFFNHMLNELEEYIGILNTYMTGGIPFANPVHYHLLWLSDAAGHAAAVISELDETEKIDIEKSRNFEKGFADLYDKAEEVAAYMRTGLDKFPALDCLNCQAENMMVPFKKYLEELLEKKLENKLLGTLMPLILDHMAREECYYLTKLSQVSDVRSPGCDPGKPRVE